MTRLARYTQGLFGINATSNQMAEYGSKAAGTPLEYSGATITPAIVQNLSQYASGWYSAVIGPYSPALQDQNSIDYLWSYQLSYGLQLGIAEWDSATTYYIGSIAQDGSGTLYTSKIDSNLNNALTNGADWQAPSLPGVITPNTVPYSGSVTLVANQSLMWPFMNIVSGQTFNVVSGSQLIGISKINISGTGILKITGTGICRII